MSLAAYAARAGLRCVSLVEPDAGARSRDAIEAVGGRVVGVASPEARWPLLADAERSLGWRAVSNRTTPPIGGDPMAIEGYRTIAYEIAEELRWTAPDLVLVPAALGDGIQGIWRGFRDLVTWAVIDRIPRMVAVEVAGAVAAALASGKDWVAPSGPMESQAQALAGVTGTVQSLHAVVESEGLVVRVSESELEHARMQLGELEGMWTDLAAAAPVAAAIKLAQRGDVPARTLVVPVLTGHGAFDELVGRVRAARDWSTPAWTSSCACSPSAASRVWRRWRSPPTPTATTSPATGSTRRAASGSRTRTRPRAR